MLVHIESDPRRGSDLAAEIVAAQVRAEPATVLGLATGSTPLAMYRRLIEMHRLEQLDFSQVTTFNPDEFVGVPVDHPASWHAYMTKELFGSLNLTPSRCHLPDGNARDLDAMIDAYTRSIEMAGGIDLQIVGVGGDGHIAANDPGSSLASRMRRVVITLNKRGYLADAFGGADRIPRFAVTLGLADFLDSAHAVVLAFGAGKAEVVARMVEGPVTAALPASVLQMHPNVDVIIDEAAAAELQSADYWREARRRARG
ncbi:MAG: glucosamine-6-phosphate deaminase [Acidobacteriota bacterium]|jgi:glucosamine-6-phosphate deaminase